MFEPTAIYAPNPHRYDTMTYNRAGTSGLKLPAVSLGFWHNFGDITPFDQMKSLVFTAFDNGITHFDLANNYGPEPGMAYCIDTEKVKRSIPVFEKFAHEVYGL